MLIIVSDPRTNNNVNIDVETDHTVTDIISLIVDHWNLSSGNYFLVFSRKSIVLESGAQIGDTEVEEGELLTLIPDPQGGAEPPIRPQQQWRNIIKNEVKGIRSFADGFYPILEERSERLKHTIVIKLNNSPCYRITEGRDIPELVQEHELELRLDRSFPDSPPEAVFKTPIFHPNIYTDRKKVCIGMLTEWSHQFSLIDLVKNIERMLWTPVLDDAANSNAVSHYRENPIEGPKRIWGNSQRHPPKIIARRGPRVMGTNGKSGPRIVG